MRTYYHGEYAWQDRVLDVSEACEEVAKLQRKSLHLQASANQSAKVLHIESGQAAGEQHREMLNAAEAQTVELAEIRAAQEEIAAEIRCGMNLIVDRMDRQLELFSQAMSILNEINQTLKIPRATEAMELYRQGDLWFKQGLLEESLDAFLKAEQIYKVNYLLQFRIGSLFLEGRNRKSNVIDISRAEPHFLLATRYAESLKSDDPTVQKICGDAYYRAGIAAYLLAKEQTKLDDLESAESCLRRALGHLEMSQVKWPENT
jgi:tetratricopeptide (TPR) repeat protein